MPDIPPLTRPHVLTLRAEGAAQLLLALVLFQSSGASWWLFGALILAPDLSAIGYLAGPRHGARLYNLVHSTVIPLPLLALGLLAQMPLLTALAAIWWAHIGMDRAVGYGLKHPDSFKRTHLSLPKRA